MLSIAGVPAVLPRDGYSAPHPTPPVACLIQGHTPNPLAPPCRGPLKPPFNEQARAKAGFGPEWYLPLAQLPESSTAALAGAAAQQAEAGPAAEVDQEADQ